MSNGPFFDGIISMLTSHCCFSGPFPTENSCRHMAAHLPPKDGMVTYKVLVI